MYVCMYLCMYMYACMYVCIMYVRMFVRMYVCMYRCMYVYKHTHDSLKGNGCHVTKHLSSKLKAVMTFSCSPLKLANWMLGS